MFTPASAHPTDAVLSDFVLGKLPDPDDAEVGIHIAECPQCQNRAANAQPDDTLLSLLAAAGTRADAVQSVPLALPSEITPPDFAQTRVWDNAPAPDSPAPQFDGSAGSGARTLPAGLTDHPRYRLVRPLGAGGMGDVWLAEHAVMGRPVALKVIRPEFLARFGAVERFRREVRAVAALQHLNIATAYDADEAGGTHFLVMEYVHGETLAEVVRRGPLPVAEACRAARDAARGLAHAHAAGLVHRDVKPSNLIRGADGTVKVLDFGLVGTAAEAVGLTGENMVMGTPDYIAPEQANDARTADARSDVYALGCALYHLLAGRVPFPAGTALQKLDAHRDPKRAPGPVAGVPAKLARVLARMMAKRPADRYQTAAAAADALDPFCAALAEEPGGAVGASRPVPTGRPPRRRLAVAAGVLFALCAVAAGGVVYQIQRGNEVITVETDDPDIEIVMKRNGELVRIVDTKTKQVWELDTQKMRLKPDGGELSIDVPGGEPLVIRRNGNTAFAIRRAPGAAPIIPPVAREEPVAEVRRFGFAGGTIRAVAYSPDGTQVLSGSGWPASDLTLRLWDVATGKPVWAVKQPRWITAVAFAGDRILVGGFAQVVYVVDRKTGAALGTLDGNHGGDIHSIVVSPDGQSVLTGSGDMTARLWDLATGKPIREFRGPKGFVLGVAFSPDGKLVAAGSNDGTVRVWDAATGKPKHKDYPGAESKVGYGVAFTRDGRHLLFTEEGTAMLWDFEAGKVVRKYPGGGGRGGAALAVSPDGRRLLTGGGDLILRLFDIDSGKVVKEFAGHTDRIWGVAFSPDGRFGLTGSGGRVTDGKPPEIGDDHTMRLWELPPASPAAPSGVTRFDGQTGLVSDVVLTPDGKQAVSVDEAGLVIVRELSSGKVLRRFPTRAIKWTSLAVSADGKLVAMGCVNSTLRWYDLSSGNELGSVSDPTGRVRGVAFTRDGKHLLAGGWDGARLWELATGKVVRTYGGGAGVTHWAALSPDERFVLTAHGGEPNVRGKVRVFERDTGKPVRTLTGSLGGCGSATFSPDGTRLSAGGADAQVWELASGKELAVFTHPGPVQRAAFTPDGRRLVTVYCTTPAADHGGLAVWDIDTSKAVVAPDASQPGSASLAITPDGRTAVVSEFGGNVRLHPLPDPRLVVVCEHRLFIGHTNIVRDVVFTSDGKTAISVGIDRVVRVWDVATGRQTRTLPHENIIIGIRLSPDDRYLLAAGHDFARLWDLKEGKEVANYPHLKGCECVDFSPDGKRVLTTGWDGTIREWDRGTGAEIRKFDGHGAHVWLAAYLPDGKRIVSGSGDDSRLWSLETGKELRRFPACITAVSADGTRLASFSGDGPVRVWETDTGKLLFRLDGHAGVATPRTFSADGRRLLTVGRDDKTVRVWNLATGHEAYRLEGHTAGVWAATFSPDGKSVLSGGEDRTLRLWRLPEPQHAVVPAKQP